MLFTKGNLASACCGRLHNSALQASMYAARYIGFMLALQELRGMNLAEAGVTDESNFVCNQCGGIVSKSRQAAHQQFWCQANRHY